MFYLERQFGSNVQLLRVTKTELHAKTHRSKRGSHLSCGIWSVNIKVKNIQTHLLVFILRSLPF